MLTRNPYPPFGPPSPPFGTPPPHHGWHPKPHFLGPGGAFSPHAIGKTVIAVAIIASLCHAWGGMAEVLIKVAHLALLAVFLLAAHVLLHRFHRHCPPHHPPHHHHGPGPKPFPWWRRRGSHWDHHRHHACGPMHFSPHGPPGPHPGCVPPEADPTDGENCDEGRFPGPPGRPPFWDFPLPGPPRGCPFANFMGGAPSSSWGPRFPGPSPWNMVGRGGFQGDYGQPFPPHFHGEGPQGPPFHVPHPHGHFNPPPPPHWHSTPPGDVAFDGPPFSPMMNGGPNTFAPPPPHHSFSPHHRFGPNQQPPFTPFGPKPRGGKRFRRGYSF